MDKFYNHLALFFGYHDLGHIIFYPGRSLDTNAKSILLFPDSCIVTRSPKSKIIVPMFNYTFYLLDVLNGELKIMEYFMFISNKNNRTQIKDVELEYNIAVEKATKLRGKHCGKQR